MSYEIFMKNLNDDIFTITNNDKKNINKYVEEQIEQININLKKQYEIIYNNKKELLKHNFNVYFRKLVQSIETEYDIEINSNGLFFDINKDFEKSMNNTQSNSQLECKQLSQSLPKPEPKLAHKQETQQILEPISQSAPKLEHKQETQQLSEPKLNHKQEAQQVLEPKLDHKEEAQQVSEPKLDHKQETQQVSEPISKPVVEPKKYSPTCLCYNKKKKMYCGRPTKVGDFCGYHKDQAN